MVGVAEIEGNLAEAQIGCLECTGAKTLPAVVPGGPGNPLGARALYLGDSEYRIHGTNAPKSIGQNASSGCIRMLNEHVIDLYGKAPVGTRVVVIG